MEKRKLYQLFAITFGIGILLHISGCAAFKDRTIIIPDTIIDFTPASGNTYNIEWPGPPRRALRYSDVKFYIPQVELSTPASTNYTQRFKIKADRWMWPDKDIGEFEVVYDAGQTNPTFIRYASALQNAQPPDNAPAETIGQFWLGCTQKGKVKGNINKHSNSTVVYLKEEDRQISANTTVAGRISPRYTIQCLDIPSPSQPEPSACGAGRKCCGAIIDGKCHGDCWPQNLHCP